MSEPINNIECNEITEEQYNERKKAEEEIRARGEAAAKHAEELRQPPYYHFKEEFPDMVWHFKQLAFGERECVGVTYDGVEFGPPMYNLERPTYVVTPQVNVDVIRWNNARLLFEDAVNNYYRLGVPSVSRKKDMEIALKWVKEEYPKIVESYNVWYNKWYRKLWRVVKQNWNESFKTEAPLDPTSVI